MPRRILFLLPALFLLCAAVSARAQERGPCSQTPPSDSTYYDDMKESPAGKWTLAYVMDRAQANDTAVPVFVHGLNGISSRKQHAAKLSCAEIENRSGRMVKAVTLRWVVTALGSDKTLVEGGPVLAKGTLPVVEAEIPPGVRQKVELHGAHFADFVRPLMVAGEVNGQYSVSIGVAHVEFADGTSLDLP